MELTEACMTRGPSFGLRWRDLRSMVREWVKRMLLASLVWLERADSNLVSYAEKELRILGLRDGDTMNESMAEAALQIVAVFASQGHSGLSASYCTQLVERLMRYSPLTPLTGADFEWNEVGNGVFQNNRCHHVFKQADRFDGRPYDLDARVFREPSGACFTNADSMQPITFPYTPKSEYVDVSATNQESGRG